MKYIASILLLINLNGYGQSHYPGQHQGKIKLNDTDNVTLFGFDVKDVKLLDSRFKDNMERESEWIMSLKTNKLLHSFKTNAGVYAGREGGYMTVEKLGGWESLDCELRGHSMGHILSGLSLLYASTGNENYKIKADSLVAGLSEVQKTINQDGYLSAYPQNLIDRNIAGQSVWAPWYTLHKLFSGLIDQYLHCNNQQALEIVEGMANWAYKKLSPLSEEQRSTMLRNEFGGINDSFYTLYEITGNSKYKFLATFFYHKDVLDPLSKEEDILNKKHANTYIPKLIGLIREYEIEGKEQSRAIPEFFWNTVVNHHTFVTGSNSDKEKFFEPDQLSKHLSGYTGESCNVYNMLKLTRHLHAVKPIVKYVDFYEKALFNHILGQQDPATGMISYFLPMKPGAHKVYSTPEDSFWCCVGTGFENQAKYGEFIYSHNENEIFVNLFIASEVNWEEQGFKLKQETKFPNKEAILLTIEEATAKFTSIYIRYPSWATQGVEITINGKKQKIKQKAGSYIKLEKTWNKGDKIKITFPMKLKIESTPDDKNVVAVTYGPIVLAGRKGTENMEKPAPYSNPKLYNDYYTYDYKIPDELSNSLNLNEKQFLKNIERKEESDLNFILKTKNIELSPIYNIHGERYIIYWNLN